MQYFYRLLTKYDSKSRCFAAYLHIIYIYVYAYDIIIYTTFLV